MKQVLQGLLAATLMLFSAGGANAQVITENHLIQASAKVKEKLALSESMATPVATQVSETKANRVARVAARVPSSMADFKFADFFPANTRYGELNGALNNNSHNSTIGLELPKSGISMGYPHFPGFYHTSGQVGILNLEETSLNLTNGIQITGMMNGNIFCYLLWLGNEDGTYYVGMLPSDENDSSYAFTGILSTYKPITGDPSEYGSAAKYFQIVPTQWNGSKYVNLGGYWIGTVTIDNAKKEYVIKMPSFKILLADSDGYYISDPYYYDSYEVHVPMTEKAFNAVVKDVKRTKNVDYSRAYPAIVDWSFDNKSFDIKNFSGNGYAVELEQKSSTQMVGTPGSIHGTIDPFNKKVTIPSQWARADIKYDASGTQGQPYKLTKAGNYSYVDFGGSYTLSPLNHASGTSRHRWHKGDKGELTTSVKVNLSVDNFDLHSKDLYNSSAPLGHVGTWKNTNYDFEAEYTAAPTLSNLVTNVYTGAIHVQANVNEKNEDLVDHYELVVIPGHHTTCQTADFINDNHGHNKAVNLATFAVAEKTNAPQRAIAKAGSNPRFNVQFTKEDLKNAGWTDAEANNITSRTGATYYIKTIYKPGTNGAQLEPSFHSLTLPTIATGIEGVVSDEAPVEYYNLQGVRVIEPAEGQVVIRRQGNKAEKIIF